jgi:hypothetical protein
MQLLPLYLRKEPTTDSFLLAAVERGQCRLDKRNQDVVIYRDPACTELFARWPWRYGNKPDRRYTTVTLNCYKWQVIWCPSL